LFEGSIKPTPADANEAAAIVRRITVSYQGTKGDPYSVCARLIAGKARKAIRDDLSRLTPAWRDHAIACVYAALMPRSRRKKLGAYFTPPHLVDHLLATLRLNGVDPVKQSFRDPAAGGAAFIVPLARMKVAAWRAAGESNRTILASLPSHLSGTDIEPGLVKLANALIRKMLTAEFGMADKAARNVTLVACADSLIVQEMTLGPQVHEVGNPPYRRLPRARQRKLQSTFADIESGRLNLYTMFVRRALDRVAPGQLVAYVLPSSFLGGPEFAAFRKRVLQLAHVRVIDIVEKRRDLFLDAIQDACVLLLQRRDPTARQALQTQCGVLRASGVYEHSGDTTLSKSGAPWKLAQLKGPKHTATLRDWGYKATIGYLVSNRQPKRLFKTPGKNRYPLIWAKAITPDGTFDFARSGEFRDRLWASAPANAPYVVRTPCVGLQRISARGQKRRLVAGAISKGFMRKHRGVIGENHIVFLIPIRQNAVPPIELAQMLNTPEASLQFDRISGSSSISARLLETMPLPPVPWKNRASSPGR
jgi:adenine-specific DNA-methyltransferase